MNDNEYECRKLDSKAEKLIDAAIRKTGHDPNSDDSLERRFKNQLREEYSRLNSPHMFKLMFCLRDPLCEADRLVLKWYNKDINDEEYDSFLAREPDADLLDDYAQCVDKLTSSYRKITLLPGKIINSISDISELKGEIDFLKNSSKFAGNVFTKMKTCLWRARKTHNMGSATLKGFTGTTAFDLFLTVSSQAVEAFEIAFSGNCKNAKVSLSQFTAKAELLAPTELSSMATQIADECNYARYEIQKQQLTGAKLGSENTPRSPILTKKSPEDIRPDRSGVSTKEGLLPCTAATAPPTAQPNKSRITYPDDPIKGELYRLLVDCMRKDRNQTETAREFLREREGKAEESRVKSELSQFRRWRKPYKHLINS